MHRLLPAYVSVVLLAGLTVAACGPASTGEPGSDRTHGETVLRRGNGGDPGSLDPSLAEDDHAFRVLTDLYEGLVVTDSGGAIVPGAASTWTISDNGLRYTFTLRPDARWSNGDPVTAGQFVDSFRRTLAPGSQSAYAFLLHPIRHATQVQQDERALADLGVSAPDAQTLIIDLAAPAPHFLSVLAMPIAFPLPPGAGAPGYRFSDPGQFVGNGPYVLEDWRPGHQVRLRKNPQFHALHPDMVDVVEYYAVADLQSEFNMYRAGELDITASVPGPHIPALRKERPGELRISPKLGLYYLAFDLSEAPFEDAALRAALSMAIDRETLAGIIGRGEQPAYGLVPPGIAGYDPPSYDWKAATEADRIAEARRLYASSTLAQEPDATVTLLYDTGDVHEKVALAVSGMWRDALGLNVKLDKREWQYFLDTRKRRDEWQVMRFAWIGDYNHPSTFLDLFRSDSPQNLPGYARGGYDDLLDSAAAANAADQLAAAEAALLADYPIAPLYFYVGKHLVSPAVEGFDDNALDRHPSRYVRLAAPGAAD